MARIRSIKPEFPQSETVGRLSRDARLLFIQLWTIVDDDGRTRAAARMLASLLFPYDDDAPALIEGWLVELEREGCVRRYVVDGASYLDLPNWSKHQRIDKPTASKLPPFPGDLASPPEGSPTPPGDLATGIGKGEEEEREGDRGRAGARPPDWPDDFERGFANAYPRTAGDPGKVRDALAAVAEKGEVRFAALIEAARSYGAGTEPRFVCNPERWLREERFRNEPAFKTTAAPTRLATVFVEAGTPAYAAWAEYEAKQGRGFKPFETGPGGVSGRSRPSRWPPGHAPPHAAAA